MKNQITLGGTRLGTTPTTKNEADAQFFTVAIITAMGMYTAHFLAQKYDYDRDYETNKRVLSPEKDYTFIPSTGKDGTQRRNEIGERLFRTVPGFDEVKQSYMNLYLKERGEFLEAEADRARRARAESGGYR
jgi:hypothetical protein